MSRSKVAPLSKTPALRKSEKAAVKTGAKTAIKAKLPAPALTTSRKALLVDGSDHAFRQLVHTLLAFLARHETVREGHAAAIGLAGIEYTVLISVKYLALTVTQAGDALLASLNPTQRQVNDVQFDCLSADEFHQLLGSVERLVESSERAIALQRYLQPRAPETSVPADDDTRPARRKKII